MPRRLLIQLARLGDLLQSLPALSVLQKTHSDSSFDLLCPLPLVTLGALFPGIDNVIPWNGEEWHLLATGWDGRFDHSLPQAIEYFSRFPSTSYSVAYNLNNHPRSILAAHLLSGHVVGAGDQGPLNRSLPPWVGYLRQVAHERGNNRIHLADAFCGVCGVKPPAVMPGLQSSDMQLPSDLAQLVADPSLLTMAIVIGAGDADRRVPLSVWQEFIQSCTERIPNCRLLIIGGSGERESSLVLEHNLADHVRNQVINFCGRTSLPQLASFFEHCQWVVGADTGPLHLGVACGARAVGWYFSHARVHETGPYGEGHWVLQAESSQGATSVNREGFYAANPVQWPVRESLDLIVDENCRSVLDGWKVWKSHRDSLGVFYSELGHPPISGVERERTWQRLGSATVTARNSPMEMAGASDFGFN